jgi:hypothetical protein
MKSLSLPSTQNRQLLAAKILDFLNKDAVARHSARGSRVWIVLDALGQKSRNRWIIEPGVVIGSVGIAESIAASMVVLLNEHRGTVFDVSLEFN